MRQVHKLRGKKVSLLAKHAQTALLLSHSIPPRSASLPIWEDISSSPHLTPLPLLLLVPSPFSFSPALVSPRVSSHLPTDLYTLGILPHVLIHVFKISSYHKMYIQAFMPLGKRKGVSLLRRPFHSCHQLSANELLVTHTHIYTPAFVSISVTASTVKQWCVQHRALKQESSMCWRPGTSQEVVWAHKPLFSIYTMNGSVRTQNHTHAVCWLECSLA